MTIPPVNNAIISTTNKIVIKPPPCEMATRIRININTVDKGTPNSNKSKRRRANDISIIYLCIYMTENLCEFYKDHI